MRKLLSYLLVSCLTVTTMSVQWQEQVRAESYLSAPIIDSEGKATWDCVYFGAYPQSDATGETSEPIKWRVLSVSESEALLIADSNLDVQRYNEIMESVTWETSTLRIWLNDYFYNKAFSEEEQEYILDSTVENSAYNEYGISGGNNTVDKVFVLSLDEATKSEYGFSSATGEDPGRIRRNTKYVAAGGYLSDEGSNAYPEGSADAWWLRTHGDSSYKVANVIYKGDIATEGDIVNFKNSAVCPVIRIDISSNLWTYAGTIDSNEETDDGVEETTTEEVTTAEITTEQMTAEITTAEITTAEVTMEQSTTKEIVVETTTTPEMTTAKSTKGETDIQEKDTEKSTQKIKVARSRIKKAVKKKKAKSIKVSFKKVKNAGKYILAFSTTKKFKKTLIKKKVKKISVIVKHKKLNDKSKLFVRVRAIVIKDGVTHYGNWSKAKRVKINESK